MIVSERQCGGGRAPDRGADRLRRPPNRMLSQQRLLDHVSRDLRTTWHELPEAIAQLQERTRSAERETATMRGKTGRIAGR